jgi:4-oxalocrotonate tautomerase
MPHVIVKLWPGKSDEQKSRLAETITRGVTDIIGKWNDLAKQPGYGARPTDQRHGS